MQYIDHKFTTLSIPQKYFIERSIELLYRGTIDTYRSRVRNPKSVLNELRVTIEAFENGTLKHFIAIASKGGTNFALKDEAISLCGLEPDYLIYNTFSKEYFLSALRDLSEHNFKQLKNCLSIILHENQGYTNNIITGLTELLSKNPSDKEELFKLLDKIEKSISFLFTDLQEQGFSKGFLYRNIFGLFVANVSVTDIFEDKFNEFVTRVNLLENNYTIIFRVDSTKGVIKTIQSTMPEMVVCADIDSITQIDDSHVKELDNYKLKAPNRAFVKCTIAVPDYLAALKKAKAMLAENLDIINLGFSGEFLKAHHRVLVIDNNDPGKARFQNGSYFLDGKYTVAREHYLTFMQKVPKILQSTTIGQETKEKIKSAVRYLRLGNESTEVEHKFINYWIGLEYLFSSNDSYDTIGRLKTFFVACHSLIYVKRNLITFHSNINDINKRAGKNLTLYTPTNVDCLTEPKFYDQIISEFMSTSPLIAQRAFVLKTKLLSSNPKKNIGEYIEQHQKNLIIHLTRIYRVRNEIVHDAATDTNNEHLAANLRYYLTFSLNGILDFLEKKSSEIVSIEDYFTINEIYLGNIKHNGWPLKSLIEVPSAIDFIS